MSRTSSPISIKASNDKHHEALDASPGERLAILREAKTVALVGVSPNPLRSSNFVATYLTRTPYDDVAGQSPCRGGARSKELSDFGGPAGRS